jgi:hypothetical protein
MNGASLHGRGPKEKRQHSEYGAFALLQRPVFTLMTRVQGQIPQTDTKRPPQRGCKLPVFNSRFLFQH